MSGDGTIRPASPAEAESIHRLVERAYTTYVERMGRRPSPMDDDYGALIAEGEVFVADQDGIAGVIVLRTHPDHVLVENVAVDPDRQGRGLGRALLAFAEMRAHAAGLDELRLYTNQAMTENIAMYERLGWAETHRSETGGYARVHFAKRLDAD